jgi:hypothetical protein
MWEYVGQSVRISLVPLLEEISCLALLLVKRNELQQPSAKNRKYELSHDFENQNYRGPDTRLTFHHSIIPFLRSSAYNSLIMYLLPSVWPHLTHLPCVSLSNYYCKL